MRVFNGNHGITRLEFAVAVGFILLLAAILMPVFIRGREGFRQKACKEGNLSEIGRALQLYCENYNGMLPSSILRQTNRKAKWSPEESARFCAELGAVPPPANLKSEDIHWVQLLWPYMKYSKDIIWCPSDPVRPRKLGFLKFNPKSHDFVSYIYKPAVDRAWFDSSLPIDPEHPEKGQRMQHFRRLEDFPHMAEQVVFFEKQGWHWEERGRGWREGMYMDIVYIDGHASAITLKEAIGCDYPQTAAELAKRMSHSGEPLWFNCKGDGENRKTGKGQWYDPRVYYDELP